MQKAHIILLIPITSVVMLGNAGKRGTNFYKDAILLPHSNRDAEGAASLP